MLKHFVCTQIAYQVHNVTDKIGQNVFWGIISESWIVCLVVFFKIMSCRRAENFKRCVRQGFWMHKMVEYHISFCSSWHLKDAMTKTFQINLHKPRCWCWMWIPSVHDSKGIVGEKSRGIRGSSSETVEWKYSSGWG